MVRGEIPHLGGGHSGRCRMVQNGDNLLATVDARQSDIEDKM